MGTKNNLGAYDCHAALDPDEPYFLLRGSHPLSAELVRLWAALRDRDFYSAALSFAALVEIAPELPAAEEAKIHEACACALAMEAWQRQGLSARCSSTVT